MKKTTRRMITLLLALVMAFSVSSTCFALAHAETSYQGTASLTWASDNYLQLFSSLPNTTECAPSSLQSIPYSLSYSPVDSRDILNASLTFSLPLPNSVNTFFVSGQLKLLEITDTLTIWEGCLSGSHTIDSIDYKINVGLQKSVNSNAINAGVTLQPLSANSMSDYIFFSFGETVVPLNIATSLVNGIQSQSLPASDPVLLSQNSNWVLASDIAVHWPSNASFSGYAHAQDVYVDNNPGKVAVVVSCYTDNVNEYFLRHGFAGTTVDSISYNLEKTNNGNPFIVGLANHPSNAGNTFDISKSEFWEMIVSIAGDLGFPTSIVDILEALLSHSTGGVSITSTTENMTATVSFSSSDNSKIDPPGLPAIFQLGSFSPSAATFSATTSVRYRVVSIPTGAPTSTTFYPESPSISSPSFTVVASS